MIDVCLLGTGGMMPLPFRYLTSLLLRYNGSSLMIDCGEGTQMALRKAGLSPNPIDIICFTHYHGDHISGLPGMLLTIGNSGRTDPLHLIGPKGLSRVVNSLRVLTPELPYSLIYHEFPETEADFEINGYCIHAFKVNHNVPCFGYTVSVKRLGLFDPVKAKENDIPLKYWNRLQHGETITYENGLYTPDMVMGPERKGLKIIYVTDTRPTDSIEENAAGADLAIFEGMYGDEEKEEKVRGHKHMMMKEAAQIASKAGVKELWFTHYSPAMLHPENYENDLKKIFPDLCIPRDGKMTELNFEE